MEPVIVHPIQMTKNVQPRALRAPDRDIFQVFLLSKTSATNSLISLCSDPLNCSQYFFCEGPQGASLAYECPEGYVYNSLTRECKRRVSPADCSTVNCASSYDQYVAYPADPSYYALCLVTDDSTTPIVFRCPKSEQFVQSQIRCVFQCKKEGRVADGRDCSKYYECYRNGLNFIKLHQKCLPGFIFDSVENGCVEGTCSVDEEIGSGAGVVTD